MAHATDIYFSHFWKLGSPGLSCQQIPFQLRDLFLAPRPLPPACVFPQWRERALGSCLPYKDPISILTSSKPAYLPTAPSLKTITKGARASPYEFGRTAGGEGGHKHSIYNNIGL